MIIYDVYTHTYTFTYIYTHVLIKLIWIMYTWYTEQTFRGWNSGLLGWDKALLGQPLTNWNGMGGMFHVSSRPKKWLDMGKFCWVLVVWGVIYIYTRAWVDMTCWHPRICGVDESWPWLSMGSPRRWKRDGHGNARKSPPFYLLGPPYIQTENSSRDLPTGSWDDTRIISWCSQGRRFRFAHVPWGLNT